MDLQSFINNCYCLNDNRIELGDEHCDKSYKKLKKIILKNEGSYSKNGFNFKNGGALKLLDGLKNGERPNSIKEYDFFATKDEEVLSKLVHCCLPLDGEYRILEPHAGEGHIVDYLIDQFPVEKSDIHCVELNKGRAQILKQKGYNVSEEDFLTWNPIGKFDIVYANPPFTNWKKHLEKMVQCLEKMGSLVCILPRNCDKAGIRDQFGSCFESVEFYDLPKGSFKSSRTMVETLICSMSFREE